MLIIPGTVDINLSATKTLRYVPATAGNLKTDLASIAIFERIEGTNQLLFLATIAADGSVDVQKIA